MEHLLNLSKAARLVGISRGKLQQQIQDGELESFEGQVRMHDLARLYPDTNMLPEMENLERYERIIEEALIRARYKKMESLLTPDPAILAARAASLNHELANTRSKLYQYELLFQQLSERLKHPEDFHIDPHSSKTLLHWLDDAIKPNVDLSHLRHLLDQESFYHIMSAHVLIKPTEHDFFVDGNDSLLESALRVGMSVDYGCSNGNCGKCKARLVSGEIKKIRNHDYVISEADKIQGYFLMCSNTALSDLIIEADEAQNEEDIPIQSIEARIKRVEHRGEIAIIQARMPRTERLRFMAGQNVDLAIGDIKQHHCYITSCPCDELNLQFHLDTSKPSAFMQQFRVGNKYPAKISLNGPFGNFTLEKESEQPLYFIAYDTGFAPIKGLIENAIALEKAQSIFLYLFSSTENHYMQNQARAWEDALDHFHFQECSDFNEVNLAQTTLEMARIYIAGPAHWTGPVHDRLLQIGIAEHQMLIENID